MKRRQAFTLVELLVSMALIIFIMAILSQAFVYAMTTFRNLKAAGDLAEKLRATTQILQRDLAANHFEGAKRLSDPDFWEYGPPQQGFFRIWQGSAGIAESLKGDTDLINSYRSFNHYLAFTIRLSGNQMSDFVSASALGGGALLSTINVPISGEARYQLTSGVGTYNYQWAEVAWFLQPSINTATASVDMTNPDPAAASAPVPLYTLYRRQRLLVPNNKYVTPTQQFNGYSSFTEASCWPDSWSNPPSTDWHFNSPMDIAVPWRRFGMAVPPNPKNLNDIYHAGLLYPVATGYPGPGWPNTNMWVASGPNHGAPIYAPTWTPYYPTFYDQIAPATLDGADIQLTDVVSFDVRVYVPGITNVNDPFVTLFHAGFDGYRHNPAFFNRNTNPTAPAVFDTWTQPHDSLNDNYLQWSTPNLPVSIPLWSPFTMTEPMGGPIIKAVQVTIRIWDFKTNQTRQVTLVQAM